MAKRKTTRKKLEAAGATIRPKRSFITGDSLDVLATPAKAPPGAPATVQTSALASRDYEIMYLRSEVASLKESNTRLQGQIEAYKQMARDAIRENS